MKSTSEIAELSKKMAFDVAKVAIEQGHALQITDEQLRAKIDKNFWKPQYREYRRVTI